MIELLRDVIHIPLNTVVSGPTGIVAPCFPTSKNAQLHGAPKLVADQTFGSVLAFSGTDTAATPDHLALHGLALDTDVALGGWVRVDPKSGPKTRTLFALHGAELTLAVRTRIDGTKDVVEVEVNGQWLQGHIPPGEWVHVLVTVDQQEAALLVNGVAATSSHLLAPAAVSDADSLYIGADPLSKYHAFAGHLAHIRIYPALAKKKHPLVWTLDRAPTENFRTYSPLEFELYDERQKPLIYVEGGEVAHRLTMAIWNRDEHNKAIMLTRPDKEALARLNGLKTKSAFANLMALRNEDRQAMLDTLPTNMRRKAESALEGMPQSPDAAIMFRRDLQDYFRHNHHFEIRFPPAVLSDKTLAWAESQLVRLLSRRPAVVEDAWYICGDRDPVDQSGVLYLHAATTRSELAPQDAASLGPDLTIALPHIAAAQDAEGQVVPVEVRAGPLTRRKGDMARLGPRVRLVEVASQQGKRFIPLHFSVVGGDQVINDGKTETFVLLRLTNIDRETAIAIDRSGNLQTTFTLSCDLTQAGIERDWALVDQPSKARLWINKAQSSELSPPDPDRRTDWPADPLTARSDGVRMSWEFDGHLIATDALGPDHSVYMCLGITTGLRTGPSELVLNYRHVPNYWDGARQCRVTKSPLIYDWTDASHENRVGIGTPHPASKLGVAGNVGIGTGYAEKSAPTDGLAVQGQVGIGTSSPAGKLGVAGGVGIGWSYAFAAPPPSDGLIVEGQVGIGTSSPASSTKLHVHKGRVRISDTSGSAVLELGNNKNTNYIFTHSRTGDLYLRTDSVDHDILLQHGGNNGNVGIGTDDPKAKLHVKGRIWDQSGEVMPVGSIMAFSADKAPPGWLMCDGAHYNSDETKYAALFKLIKWRFGAIKVARVWHFLVPDLRGRFLRGRDAGTKRDPDANSRTNSTYGAWGDQVGSLQNDAYKAHTHSYTRTTGKRPLDDYSGSKNFSVSDRVGKITGSSGGKETRPKNMYVNYIIKY